jgi:hypothetical protein
MAGGHCWTSQQCHPSVRGGDYIDCSALPWTVRAELTWSWWGYGPVDGTSGMWQYWLGDKGICVPGGFTESDYGTRIRSAEPDFANLGETWIVENQ